MQLKNHLLFSLFFIFINSNSFGQGIGLEWVLDLGYFGDDFASEMHKNSDGSILYTGEFSGTVDFDPSAAVFNLTAIGGNSGFILKLDPQGNFSWVKQIGGAGTFTGEDIVTDNHKNIYLTGTFSGTLDFDPNSGVFNISALIADAFVLKLDSAGNFKWVKQFNGPDWVRPASVAVDTVGNVYTTGSFKGVVDFDPDTSVFSLTATTSTFSTFGDMYVQKLDSAGVFQWAIKYGSSLKDFGSNIVIDPAQNILVTGSFSLTIDFDPGPGVFSQTASGLTEIVLIKLTPNANLIWVRNMGGNGYDTMESMKMDNDGNIYSTGTYAGNSSDFDPGPAVLNLSYMGSGTLDTFIQKLDSAGNLLWVKSISDSWDQKGLAIAIDSLKNVYITGEFKEIADFNPGLGEFELSSNGNSDIFILKLDSLGGFAWVKQIGGAGFDGGSSIVVHGNSVYVSGYYGDTVDFDPNYGFYNLIANQGSFKTFLLKLNPCSHTTAVDAIQACESYTWIDGITYYASNDSAVHVIGNAAGCDSIITLDLTINNMVFGFDSIVTCGPYTWIDGITYTASTNTPSYFLYGGSVAGCDSIATLHLTIIDSAISIDSYNECDALTWLDGNTYTSSNSSAFIVLPGASAAGCDSTIFLDLTIEPIDITVSQTDQVTFTANATNATYQWLNCDNGFAPIVGETNQTFIASDNGNYAVEITNTNNCSDTSICYAVAGLSIQTVNPFAGVSIYPNPTNGLVNIDFKNGQNVSISVYNALGQIVFAKQNIKEGTTNFELTGEPGVYTVEVNIDGLKQNYKVVKE